MHAILTHNHSLERYIDALSKHILKIQEEESYITSKFTEKLEALKGDKYVFTTY